MAHVQPEKYTMKLVLHYLKVSTGKPCLNLRDFDPVSEIFKPTAGLKGVRDKTTNITFLLGLVSQVRISSCISEYKHIQFKESNW